MQHYIDYSRQVRGNSWRKIVFEAGALLIVALVFAQTALRLLANVH